MGVSNIVIGMVMARKRMKVARANNAIAMEAVVNALDVPLPAMPVQQGNSDRGISSQHKKNSKTNQMVLLVVGAFVCLWAPYLTMVCIIQSYVETRSTPPGFLLIIFELSKLPMITSFMVNPLIYSWKSKEIRETYRRSLHVTGLEG